MKLGFLTLILISLITALPLKAQPQRIDSEALRKTALSHMQAGRYGEAIDQLNKFISANPQNPEGYNLRGVCFEKRQQYFNGRLDYRRTIALETRDSQKRSEYEQNLSRLIGIWYPLLEKKINGHQREIAINPNNAFNYLEIGKSYMWMEIWDKAELWYDEYLARDDNASPDEIIRYTEILAKTGSIVKGERILKKYVERYPDDWRLWSRYGYFTLWLSKYAIAKKAFETALGFKPFFKEAQDGLDIVNRQAYVNQQDPRAFEREYPIDRYYRLVKRNPADIETRFKLVEELLAANRIEEAYQQLQIIGLTKAEDTRYQEKWTYVTEYRTKTYRDNLETAKANLQINPTDKDALKLVAEYYEYLQEYDSAMVMLDTYFESYPEEKDEQLRFRYARISAWSREFDKAIDITDDLLTDYPANLDYKLFRAQVSVWINRDVELAKEYLDDVLKDRPNNLEALISMGSLKLLERDFDGAQEFADKAKGIDPANDEVIKLQSNIDWQRLRAEEEKLYAILEEGRKRVMDEDCPDALLYYEEYLSKAEPNVLILREYGDVLFCAKEFQKALDTYNEVLNQGYNYDAAMQRAKVYYAIDDTLNAIKEFKALVAEDSTDFDAQLYLGDSYAKAAEYDSARTIYNMLLETWQLDSTQVSMVELRKGYLPLTGLSAILENFPNYVALAPALQFYSDNAGFSLFSLGSRLELGLTNFFSLGVSFTRSQLKAIESILDQDIISTYNYIGNIRYNTFKVHGVIRLARDLNMGAGFGRSSARGYIFRDEKDAFIRFERRDTISVSLVYQSSDASLILYSPYLIDNRYYANLIRLEGYYKHRDGLKVSGSFQYISVSDANEGNDLILRLGKYFYKDLAVGYEYYYTNYKYKASYYYSPTNFESHSIWVDNELERKKDLRVTLGGKLGIIPRNKILVLGAYLDVFYQASKSLLISGRIIAQSTSRDESSYRSFAAQLSAYWTLL
ncbi:MAG TPA: tetratricopeptide repeat protein [Melioribacteraceae bacterium]|nr:tetratricopeptide repeat protein [Melioribacteraceae bacterium]